MTIRLALAALICLALRAESKLDGLAFMAGCWTGPGNEELWMKPDGGTMLGIARNVKGGKTTFTEFVLIREEAGEPVMNVQLRLAAKSTPFRLAELKQGLAVFSNPAHDFPQRIIYRSTPGGLHARVEGKLDGKEMSEDFPMRRCGK